MLFNSLEYAIFLPIVFGLYWVLNPKFRWILMLLASCLFYMYFIPYYILILAIPVVFDYFAAIQIQNKGQTRSGKVWLISSIILTIGTLFTFKYFNFFNHNFATLFGEFGWKYPIGYLQLILPIGLSFHTFQTLSYILEVYKGEQQAERHFGIYSLYIMYFPQLVAGPIERPQNLLPQFHEAKKFDESLAADGLRQILWGLFKKMAIADNCGQCVNYIYSNYESQNSWVLLLGMMLYSFQIYCDFSGYSDIALGSSKLFGIKLMQNFNYPYFSKNINEFWSRWHISLSTWFKDYVYIPMGGSKNGKARQVRNLLVTFGLSGLWHGANWTFVFWGLLNSLFMLPKILIKSKKKSIASKLNRILKNTFSILFTFALASIAWVFFRSESIGKAFNYLYLSFSNFPLKNPLKEISEIKGIVTISILLIISLTVIEWIQRTKEHGLSKINLPVYLRWTVYLFLLTITLYVGNYHNPNQFIYFQF